LAQGQPPDHPIAQALGLELAQKIAIYFDGDYIQVPTGKAALAALKRQKIRQDLVAGLSHNEVARRNQVTVRTVYYIQRKALGSKSTQSANKDQLSLFPL
jgi:Mor family transcriptional regulator